MSEETKEFLSYLSTATLLTISTGIQRDIDWGNYPDDAYDEKAMEYIVWIAREWSIRDKS